MANTATTMSTNGASCSYSNHTLEKVAKAKATLESFYANLISQHQERQNRSGRGNTICKLYSFALCRRDIPKLLNKDLVTNNSVLHTSINLLYFGYRWKVLEMNMEQQGLTEEEVCVLLHFLLTVFATVASVRTCYRRSMT